MDPLQVHKNGKIFLLLDTEIGAVGHIASMAILPAGALFLFFNKLLNEFFSNNTGITVFDIIAVLFLSLAILFLIFGKILSYLKVRPAEYCAYWYLAHH